VITELFPTPATIVSAEVIVTSPSQLSVAVAIPVPGIVTEISGAVVCPKESPSYVKKRLPFESII
jgi:hypothetical protein